MNAVARSALTWTSASFLVLLAVSAVAGAVRLLPWVLAPNIPWGLTAPFARALAASAVEVTALVALPVGWALAASEWTDRGEARAFFSLGVSPFGLAFRTLGVAVLWVVLLGAIGSATRVESPGRFVAELVDRGRRECVRSSSRRIVEVPLARVSWLCLPGRGPRLAGAVPRFGSRAWFTAEELRPSADLREIQVRGARVSLRGGAGLPPTRLAVGHARIGGLPGWHQPRWPSSPLLRALWLAGTAVLAGLTLSVAMLRRSVSGRVWALAYGLGTGLTCVGALQWVEAHAPSTAGALAVPACGVGIALIFSVWLPGPGRRRRAPTEE